MFNPHVTAYLLSDDTERIDTHRAFPPMHRISLGCGVHAGIDRGHSVHVGSVQDLVGIVDYVIFLVFVSSLCYRKGRGGGPVGLPPSYTLHSHQWM